MSDLKRRISQLERKTAPEPPPVKYILEWGDVVTGDPAKDAEIRANRPTHNEAGERIIYLEWPDDSDWLNKGLD